MGFYLLALSLVVAVFLDTPAAQGATQSNFLDVCRNPTSPEMEKTILFLLEYVEHTDCADGYHALSALKKIETWQATGISNLLPLAFLNRLEELTIANSEQLSDVSPLAQLKGLRTLNLHAGGQLSDVSALAGLTELVDLDLSGNMISDLRFIRSLTKLEKLNLAENHLSDLSPIANLASLESLFLFNQIGSSPDYPSPLNNISALSSLTKLKTLSIRGNSIADFSVIYQMKGLREIQAVDIPASVDVDKLIASHPDLQKLTLGGGFITNLRNIGQLTDLYWLGLEGEFVGNEELKEILGFELPKLSVLSLKGTHVSDIGILDERDFFMLFLSHNRIADISPVRNMSNLVWLIADYNQISDISTLRRLESVQYYSFANNPIIADEQHCPIDAEAPWLSLFCEYYLETGGS